MLTHVNNMLETTMQLNQPSLCNCILIKQINLDFLRVLSTHGSDWLHALNIVSCGFRLENEDNRVAINLAIDVLVLHSVKHISAIQSFSSSQRS